MSGAGKAVRTLGLVDHNPEERAAIVAIVAALIEKKPLPEKALAYFVGAKLALEIVSPRATSADCTALRARLDTIATTEDFGAAYSNKKLLADEHCVGMALPAAAKTCLSDALTVHAFAQCKLPTVKLSAP